MQNNIDNNLGGFSISNWREKREKLKNDFNYNADWKEAINWFRNRLNNRYFFPMEKISDKVDGAGFTILSIQCIIIEHLVSMEKGKIHDQNVDGNNPEPSYKYRSSANHFKDFMNTSSLFSEYFSSPNGSEPEFDSSDFYTNVRCALLHEACTKNNWRINTISCGYNNPDRKILTKDNNGIKRVYRDLLLDELKTYIETYMDKLKTDRSMRLYFARKMDSLCEIEPNPNDYEWWDDF